MTLSPSQIAEAADLLIAARREGQRLSGLPEAVRPTSISEGHAIQDEVRARSGQGIGAIKVNAPKTGGVYRGMLEKAVCHRSPATIDTAEHDYVGIEAEIAFHFADGLPPSPSGYEPEAVASAARACAALDIVGTRLEDFMARSQFERIADGLNAGSFVYGPDHAGWRDIDYAKLPVSVMIDGVEVFSDTGGHLWVDPFLPVLAFVEMVKDAGLPPGTILTTGSFCGLLPIAAGETIRAVMGPLEPVQVTLHSATAPTQLRKLK
jgi:2-keto-4-pentenoate hydratase